jgi:prolipoprotein diacylglyceryltransferase
VPFGTLGAVPIAAVALDFEPFLRIGDRAFRLETMGLAIAVAIALLLAAWLARRVPTHGSLDAGDRLRPDDLLFIALAAIPGGVIGGRLGHALVHLDFYLADPLAIVDPAQGTLELALGVLGAAATGGYAAALLSGRRGAWFHVAAVPTLVVIGLGKVALALGGTGQGLPTDAAWATSYVGAGPWGSLLPAVPSHPSQLYEAAGVAVVLLLVAGLARAGRFGRHDGAAWVVAVGGWLAVRAVVGATWRDPAIVGALRGEQLVTLGALAVLAGVALLVARRGPSPAANDGPSWPDPASRPTF